MKLVAETGSGSHTTSYASCQVTYEEGPHKGKPLYTAKETVKNTEWDDSKLNEKWVTTEYDLPAGTIIHIIGKGRTGPRGCYPHAFNAIYQLDPEAEVKNIEVNVGLRTCTFTGRLVEVVKVVPVEINRNEGF